MNETYIRRHQIIEMYVQDRLSDSDLEAFEIYMLENPDIVDEVEYAKGLDEAFKGLPVESWGLTPPGLDRWMSGRAVGMALAASVFIAAGFFGLRAYLSPEDGAHYVPVEYWVESARGRDALILHVGDNEQVLLRIDIGPQPLTTYKVTLVQVDSGDELEAVVARAGEDHSILFSVPGGFYGKYELTVTGAVEGQTRTIVSHFPIEIVERQ